MTIKQVYEVGGMSWSGGNGKGKERRGEESPWTPHSLMINRSDVEAKRKGDNCKFQ